MLICLALSLVLMIGILAVALEAVFADASGKAVKKDGSLTVDASHADKGYIMAKAKKGKSRYKLRVSCGDNTMTYDLDNKSGKYEVFPLEDGSGSYTISLYKNVSGKKYSEAGKVKIKVKTDSANACLLAPNQYVNYDKNTEAVKISEEICKNLKTPREKYDAVKKYMLQNYIYDFITAVTVQPGQMPDIDRCVEKRMGICQDLSATFCCMMRVQGIESKLMIGYADKNYHAWTTTYIDGQEYFFDPTVELNAASPPKAYTLERWY